MDAPIYRIDEYDSPRPQTRTRAALALEITRGQARQKIRPVCKRVFLIGTASDCDLVLGDLSFPEAYAYLFIDGERVTIRRLGSGPELFVCGEAVETAELFRGDTVRFGPFEMRLAIDAAGCETGEPAPRGHRPVTPDSTVPPDSTSVAGIRVFCPSDAGSAKS